jgi:transcriptional regulator with GAF, ATPase, and Fis domain
VRLINQALAKHQGSPARAARSLGVDKTTIRRILARRTTSQSP